MNLFSKVKHYALTAKNKAFTYKKTSLLVIIALCGLSYFLFSKQAPAVTVTSQKVPVIRKNLSVSVSGSGTISPTNTVDLKMKGSGDLRSISIKTGQSVKRGATLMSLDASDAYKEVAQAKVNLETAELELEKIKQPPETLEILQLENQIASAKQKIADQDTVVANAYATYLSGSLEAVPEVQSTSIAAPVVSGSYVGKKEGQIKIVPYLSGDGLRFSFSGLATGDGLASLSTPQPLGDSGLYVKFSSLDGQPNWIINIPNKRSSSYANAYNNYQNALITKDKTIAEQNRTLLELEEKLKDLKAGADTLDIRARELVVAQRKNDLNDAYAKLANYAVVAPFDGVVASVVAEVGDSITPSTVLGTIITNKKIATISLNEADISKVAVGQKALLTFDALDDVKVNGEIAEIDTLGSISQGVVTYTVKIAFPDIDTSIKPGMTVTADIALENKEDVVVVANEAITEMRGKSYVEVEKADGTRERKEIVKGISSETETEVISGLTEGETVLVTRRIGTAAAQGGASLFGAPATRGSGMGGARPF